MVWKGKKTKPKETRRRDGRGTARWTGQDWTGQARTEPGEGDENQQSGGNRDRQTDRQTHTQHGDQDQTDQIDRSRDEQSTPTQQASYSHWHTATVQANEKKNDNGVGDCAVLCCAAVRCAVCVCSLLGRRGGGVLYSPCKRRAYPCRQVM